MCKSKNCSYPRRHTHVCASFVLWYLQLRGTNIITNATARPSQAISYHTVSDRYSEQEKDYETESWDLPIVPVYINYFLLSWATSK